MNTATTNRKAIQCLPESVIQKIAAGEIIERPASVVKELIENSVDAQATSIEISTAKGGMQFIRVKDNGFGIPHKEVSLALYRHATSKILVQDDLQRITTLGFRGEALASIAAVSQLDLFTRTIESDHGVKLHMLGGDLKKIEPYGMPVGTTIHVADLFYNVPARKKFLKSPHAEKTQIVHIIKKMALGRITLDFFYENDGKMDLVLPKVSNLHDRITQLYGESYSQKMIHFRETQDKYTIEGYISGNQLSFARPQEIWIFVNDRTIVDRMINSAILEGYRNALMEHRYPFVVLILTVPSDSVDVNVHPTKAQVRFAQPQLLYHLISQTIHKALQKSPIMPFTSSVQNVPVQKHDRLLTAKDQTVSWESQFNHEPQTQSTTDISTPSTSYFHGQKNFFSSLHFLGTFDNTYLIYQSDSSIILVDQHAAHERICFEKIRQNCKKNQPACQKLLIPLSLDLSKEQETALHTLLPFFLTMGFELEPFGPQSFIVRGIPSGLSLSDPTKMMKDVIDDYVDEQDGKTWLDHIDHMCSKIACHSAIRAHDPLTEEEIQSLLTQMDQTESASFCPHGRPTFIRLSRNDIEKLFCRK